MSASPQHALARRLRLGDAVFIGMGSMIGAGVFVVWSPAAAAAGQWLFIGLGLALLVAFANATSSAQLAAQYPTSGGTYVHGRERLGHWPGFVAGWGFVVGKTASIAAMALAFGHYVHSPAARWIAVAIVLLLALVNSLGVTRTARLTRIIVVVMLVVLALVVVANVLGGPRDFAGDQPAVPIAGGVYGVLQSAGLIFFAFAGYARIATMGEEVIEPERTIPRAIIIALAATAIVYAVVGAVVLWRIPPEVLAVTEAPLAFAVAYSPLVMVTSVVAAGAALATVGAMLNLMTGVGRTTLAMARTNDLPGWLSKVDRVHSVPRNAELVLAVIVCVLVILIDLRLVIGFSSFGVLIYYLIANLAAYTQDPTNRRYPRALQIFGAFACAALVITLPWQSIGLGIAVYLIGVVYRLIRRPDRDRLDQPTTKLPAAKPRRAAD